MVQGAKRYLSMLELAQQPDNPFYFSPIHVVDYLGFAEKFRHPEGGRWEITQRRADGSVDDRIILEPSQIWAECAIHGFRKKLTNERLVTRALEVEPRKNAKAAALDTPIPTPSGWTTMGRIKIGDFVIAIDGTPTMVVDESPIFSDHECYRVKFSNGEEIVADAGHRWLTTARVDRPGVGVGCAHPGRRDAPSKITRVRTTKEIFETQRYGLRADVNHSVGMPGPMVGIHQDLPIDPYVLGVWLGDGHTCATAISSGFADVDEMVANLSSRGFDLSITRKRSCAQIVLRPFGAPANATGPRKTAKKEFRKAGVLGRKHVPTQYLRADHDQRLLLLQGLMDSDGTINKNGRCLSFSTTSPKLRDDFSELLATFGLKFSVTESQNICNGRSVDGKNWRIQFFVTRGRLETFRLSRKLERMRRGDPGRSRTVQIVSVEPVASVPVKCIAVEHESHLFLIGRTMLPTHNTLRLAIAALFDLCCSGQLAPQISIAASSAKQASETLYGVLLKMLARNPDLVEHFGIKSTQEKINIGEGVIFSLSSQGERQDGLNPSLAVFEEGHAGAISVYKVIRTAFGARPNALLRMITTAGYRPEGPGYELLKEAETILDGQTEDYTFFAAIYTLDPQLYQNPETKATDWIKLLTDESLVERANPLYRVSLDPDKVAEGMREAIRKPDMRGEVARTRFNIWTSSGIALIDPDQWANCKRKIDLSDFFGAKFWGGVDLASYNDMCALGLVFETGDAIAAFVKYWIPEGSPLFSDEETHDTIMSWSEAGWLTITEGPEADYDLIEDEIVVCCEIFDCQGIAFDPYQSNQISKRVNDRGIPTYRYLNQASYMTTPTNDILGRVSSQRLLHDGNGVLAWNASNVHGERRDNGSLLPKKEKRGSKRKIDGFVATCMANGLRMEVDAKQERKPKVSAYASDRVIGLDKIDDE